MADYTISVDRYMSEPVVSIAVSATLSDAEQLLRAAGISCLAVLDSKGALVGVVSRTDLLRAGRVAAGAAAGGALLELDSTVVESAMTRDVLTVAVGASVGAAAEAMLKRGAHRVFVMSDDDLAGVFSTRDVMAVIRDQRDETVVGTHMSTPLFTVESTATLNRATALLDEAHVGGVIVVEDEWPVGMFTQLEALRCAGLDPATPVEEVMELSFVCLPASMRMHRAASQSLKLRARRVIAADHREAVGILSGLDFARCVARPT